MDNDKIGPNDVGRIISDGPGIPTHVLSMMEFNREMIEHCFRIASMLENVPRAACLEMARGRCLGVLFYQQSTRTRLSFESAMLRLGGHVVGFSDPTTTRAVGFYQETLEDVVRFAGQMADVLVLRHSETGAAARAAKRSPVPIFNAGDGSGEHPTQALGDLYHIHKHFGRIDDLAIGIVGYLGMRTHRSLVIGLSLFRVRLLVLEPPNSSIPTELLELLEKRQVCLESCANIQELLGKADIVTTLGVHHSSLNADYDNQTSGSSRQERPTPDQYRIACDAVVRLTRYVPILHVGPIADTIDRRLDEFPQAHYFKQARDCLSMRVGLLSSVISRSH